ncbi:MAG TPA: P1 family peptidase [Solirubrobacterales bacterium]|nr:P1 family peptidase [Solirubrobacterales bacterium]
MSEGTGISTEKIELPDGVTVGHWSDREGWTGCSAILGPPETVSAGEVRGGGPATREFELLSPATSTPGAHAVLLSGGSAFGVGAANGVVSWHEERGLGFSTPVGAVPLVTAAACFDLPIGDPKAHPGPDGGYAACEAAGPEFERGCVGAGTGCTAGKVGMDGWTKTGLGAATLRVGEAVLTAIAVVNPYGEVTGADGEVIAGSWRDGAYRRTVDVLLEAPQKMPLGENTTLVCLVTDAKLTKNEAWIIARSAAPGFGRALSPTSTAVDGDLAICMSTGRHEVDPFLLSIFAAEVTAEAIRDGARRATDAAGIPAASSRLS